MTHWICTIKGHNYDGEYNVTPKGGEKLTVAIICTNCGNVIDLTSIIEKVIPLCTEGKLP